MMWCLEMEAHTKFEALVTENRRARGRRVLWKVMFAACTELAKFSLAFASTRGYNCKQIRVTAN